MIAERFSSADFLHGPIALIEHDFPAFIFMPPGKTFHDMGALAARLRNLRAEVIGITSAKARAAAATRVIRVPGEIPEIYSPIPYIVPGQIFAALLAEIKVYTGFSTSRFLGVFRFAPSSDRSTQTFFSQVAAIGV